MDYLIITSQFILSLSLLIILHEFGHFLPARIFGMRVEKFYLFFDLKFALFKYKKGDTEYGVGWLPLGGYVKISGMMDESMDKEQLKEPPKDWEFRSKPAWQRLIVMLGGVTVNFILGFLIFSLINFTWGKQYLPMENLQYGIAVDSTARAMGFQDGDKIVNINGKNLKRFRDFRKELLFAEQGKVTLIRDAQEQEITLSEEELGSLAGYRGDFVGARHPLGIEEVLPNSPNKDADLQKGDRILKIEDTPTYFAHDFLREIGSFKGQEATFTLLRNGTDTIQRELSVSKSGKIGIALKGASEYLDFATQEFGLIESFPAGFQDSYSFLADYIKQFSLIFNGRVKASESLGGFGSIASLFGSEWDWRRFWHMTAILSIILGFMNLLPIPALDGGHVMFLLYEIISGRKPNEKFMEYAQIFGLILVLGLVVFANGMDIYRAIFQ